MQCIVSFLFIGITTEESMSEIHLPENKKKVYIAKIKSIHFYRDMAIVLSLIGIKETIVTYQAAEPKEERLN